MNSERPHDLRREDEIPPEKVDQYVRVVNSVAEKLAGMTVDERAKWLAAFRARMLKVEQIAPIAQGIAEKLQACVDPLIDALDEEKPDRDNGPLVVGFLVGVRAWYGQFQAIEEECVSALESGCGIPREHYERVRIMADADGLRAIERIKLLIAEEDRG